MEGTVPLSLKDALRVLGASCGGNSTTSRRSSLSDSPVDILAVIVDITYDRFGGQRAPPVDRREVVRIWIADDSIEDQEQQQANGNDDEVPVKKFMISLRNVKDRASVQQHQIATGDVIRLNRVDIRKSNNNNNNDNTSTIHFYHPFENPEAGLEWFRLGHVKNEMNMDHGSALVAMERIPNSMKTDRERLHQLLTWYRQSSLFYSPQIATLDPLPCQRRTLLQLQSLVGTLSHVVARVTNVRPATATALASSSKRHSKRQKMTAVTATMATSPRPGSSWCAELSDDGGRHTMLLLLSDSSCSGADTLRQVLMQAKDSRRPVRLTLVRTRRDENVGDHSEVFLVATNQSTATLLTDSEEAEFSKHEESSAQQQTQFPFSSCTQQQTQQTQTLQHSLKYNNTRLEESASTQTIRAFIRQIIIVDDQTDNNGNTQLPYTLNEKSTASECYKLLSQFLWGSNINTNDRTTETAKFTLELVGVDGHQLPTHFRQLDQHTAMLTPIPHPDPMLVSITPSILERLCGGAGSSIDKESVNDPKRCNQQTILANVLHVLLADQVQLEWNLLGTEEQCQQLLTAPRKPNSHVMGVVQNVILPGI